MEEEAAFWSAPPPDDVPFNDGDWSPTTQERIREVLQVGGYPGGYDAWLHDAAPQRDDFMSGLGCLNIAIVLNPMLEERRWMDAAGYMRRVFRFHRTEALAVGAAVPSADHRIWDLRWSHPELYILPRAQHALEIAAQGLLEEARVIKDELQRVIDWTAHNSGLEHGPYLRTNVQQLEYAVNPPQGHQINWRLSRLDVEAEREFTSNAIRDYLCVYLPEASGRLLTPQVVHENRDWQFADSEDGRFRCLVCHGEGFTGDLDDVRDHVRHRCRASTASVRNRLLPLDP